LLFFFYPHLWRVRSRGCRRSFSLPSSLFTFGVCAVVAAVAALPAGGPAAEQEPAAVAQGARRWHRALVPGAARPVAVAAARGRARLGGRAQDARAPREAPGGPQGEGEGRPRAPRHAAFSSFLPSRGLFSCLMARLAVSLHYLFELIFLPFF